MGGLLRPIINLKPLNRYRTPQRFRMTMYNQRRLSTFTTERLGNMPGFEGCIFSCTCASPSQSLSPIHLVETCLPLQVSALWSIQQPWDIHLNHQTLSTLPSHQGCNGGVLPVSKMCNSWLPYIGCYASGLFP